LSKYDLKKIEELRAKGKDWTAIGKEYGVKPLSVKRAYYRMLKNPSIPKKFELEIVEEYIKPVKPVRAPSTDLLEWSEPSTTKKKSIPTDDLRLIYRVLKGKTTRKGFYIIRDELVEILTEL